MNYGIKERKVSLENSGICQTWDLKEKLNPIILIVPHSIEPDEDDRIISNHIFEKIENKTDIKLIPGELYADELKGIIGICNLFVTFRMHPAIASTTMSVPTVAIGFGTKFNGIIGEQMGQEKCIIHVKNCRSEKYLSEIISKIDYVWANKESIKNDLIEKTRIMREKALLNGRCIKYLIDTQNKI